MKSFLNMLAVLVVCLACSTLAQAQATRTWVSGVGDDANPCSRTAPCKTFAGAISKTAAGGEISVLDPGGFGAVTITKSITIDGGGVIGSILAATVNAVIINAGATDKIVLRNLSINGTAGASIGINAVRFLAGKQLSVEKCEIAGFTTTGIDLVTGSAGRNLYVKNTTFTEINGTAINLGTPASGFNVANIDHVRMEGNANGLVVAANGFATISNSSLFQNGTNAVSAAGSATINVESCVFAHNGTAVNSAIGSAIRLSNATIYNNATGINAGGTVEGFFNNRVFGNATNGAVTHQTAQQ